MERFKRKMLNKFKQIIRQAYSSLVSDDTGDYPTGQITSNGKASKITRLSVYGVFGNPPKDSHVLLFQSQGQEAVKFGIYNDFLGRKKTDGEGECGLHNTLTGAIVYMKADGSIAIESDTEVTVDAPTINANGDVINAVATASANVTAPAISLTGAVTINGALVVSGAISGPSGASVSMPNGAEIDGIPFGTHVHGGVDEGTGETDGPE